VFQLIRKTLIDRKDSLKLTESSLIDMFFMFASSRPKQYGVYKVYANEDLEELLAHYEHNLCEAAVKADAE